MTFETMLWVAVNPKLLLPCKARHELHSSGFLAQLHGNPFCNICFIQIQRRASFDEVLNCSCMAHFPKHSPKHSSCIKTGIILHQTKATTFLTSSTEAALDT